MSKLSAVPITVEQLLFIDAQAYANLCLMLPCGDPANPDPLKLDPTKHQLVLIGLDKTGLFSSSPPGFFQFDRASNKWVRVQVTGDEG